MSSSQYVTLLPEGAAPEGQLTVNSVLLHRSCIQAQDLSMLVDGPDTRGADILVPGTVGVLAQPRRVTVTRRDCPFWLIGAYDWATGALQEPKQGLIDNFDALYASIGVGLQTGDGTVNCALAEPDGGTRSGSVTVLNCRRGSTRAGWWTPVVISLSVPDGVLT